MKDALETTHEITKLIKFSPKRETIFRSFKQENDLESNSSSIGIRVLCPTRWTVRADSLSSILENYSALIHTWDKLLFNSSNSADNFGHHNIKVHFHFNSTSKTTSV